MIYAMLEFEVMLEFNCTVTDDASCIHPPLSRFISLPIIIRFARAVNRVIDLENYKLSLTTDNQRYQINATAGHHVLATCTLAKMPFELAMLSQGCRGWKLMGSELPFLKL